jgi:hypothetical protein
MNLTAAFDTRGIEAMSASSRDVRIGAVAHFIRTGRDELA